MTKSRNDPKYFQLFYVLIFCCVIMGVMCSDLSSCYKADTIWRNSSLVTEIAPVLDYKECQAVCQARVGCQGWTWTTEDNAERQNYCSLYSSLGPTSEAPDCISGPPSCLCSNVEACHITEDNELELVPDITEVNN